jgi:putative CocE/NonD family hydrolase
MQTPRIDVKKNVPTPMRDGTILRADVYLPRDTGSFPTLVCRTPYDKSRPDRHPMCRRLAEAGYAVVVQDIRGRWASDGVFHPSGLGLGDGDISTFPTLASRLI